MEIASKEPSKRNITIVRTFRAPPAEVWEMWTTRKGIESWWGPDGFQSTVRTLDLRVGGSLEIAMEATGPEQRAMLEAAGQPVVNVSVHLFTEILPTRRLGFTNRVGFVQTVQPYDVASSVEFEAVHGGTRMTFISEPMHDAYWTRMAVAGWEGSFDRFEVALNPNA